MHILISLQKPVDLWNLLNVLSVCVLFFFSNKIFVILATTFLIHTFTGIV